MKTYQVLVGGYVERVVLVDEPGCGFAFLDEEGNLSSTLSSREQEVLNRMEENIEECIQEGWVQELKESQKSRIERLKKAYREFRSKMDQWEIDLMEINQITGQQLEPTIRRIQNQINDETGFSWNLKDSGEFVKEENGHLYSLDALVKVIEEIMEIGSKK